MAGKRLKVNVRWMIRRDMPDVLEIERDCFEYPWGEDDFLNCLRQRNCIGMVAVCDDERGMERIVGFIVYELFRKKLHLMSIGVAIAKRRMGVGTQMIEKMVEKLSQQRRDTIGVEVRESNLSAQMFFQKHGFRAVSILKDFYEDTTEDAYSMEFQLPAEEQIPDFTSRNRISDVPSDA